MRYNPIAYWLRKVKAYSLDPRPAKYNLTELCFIWLWVASLASEWDHGFPIVTEAAWMGITEFLEANYSLLSEEMKEEIPLEVLTWRTPWGIQRNKGKALIIDCYVGNYVTIMEGRGKLVVTKGTPGKDSHVVEANADLPPPH